MTENFSSFSCQDSQFKESVCIDTYRVLDSCRDKDCIEDLRVYLSAASQNTLDCAAGARVRCADLVYAYIDVEPVAFDRNHYCVDVTFYYRILADAIVGAARPAPLTGLAVFSKRVVLCGEDSHTHIYNSDTRIGQADGSAGFTELRIAPQIPRILPWASGSIRIPAGEVTVAWKKEENHIHFHIELPENTSARFVYDGGDSS